MEYFPGMFLCVDDILLRTQPLIVEFYYTGDTRDGDKVTSGTYSPPDETCEYTKLFPKCQRYPVMSLIVQFLTFLALLTI